MHQECGGCDYRWPGRPLVGVIETRGEPWPGIRLRLTDGVRSAAHAVSERELHLMSTEAVRPVPDILAAHWIRLERELSATGRAEHEPAGPRRRARQVWDSVAFPVLRAGAGLIRDGLS